MTSSRTSSGYSLSVGCGLGPSRLALLTSKEKPPASTAASTRGLACRGSVTSPAMAMTSPDPASSMAADAAASRSGPSRASITRFQPARASSMARARPKPRDAPVTIAVLIPPTVRPVRARGHRSPARFALGLGTEEPEGRSVLDQPTLDREQSGLGPVVEAELSQHG